jgi:PAS domain S-box-containing protein
MKPIPTTKATLPDEALLDSEARYRWLFESTAIDGIMILDAKTGQVVDVNPFLTKLLGFSREQVIKKKIWELGYFKDILASKKNFKDLLQKGFVRYDGLPLKTADGLQIDVEFVGHVYKAGNQKMIQCSIRDITARKRAEEKLWETTDFLEKLITFTNTPTVVWDSQFRITRFNHAFESLLGRTAGEVLRQTLDSLFPPARRQFALEKIQATLAGEQLQAVEVEVQPVDGDIRTLLWSAAPIFDKEGKVPIAAIGQGIDITERKRTEREIASLAKFLSENPGPVLRISRDGIVLYANAASGRLLDLWGCAVGGLAPQFWRDLTAQTLASGKNKTADIECVGKVYSIFVTPVAETGYVNLYGRDITERKQAEGMLAKSEKRFRQLSELLPEMVFETDSLGNLTFANQYGIKSLGYSLEDLQSGLNIFALVAPEDRESIKKRLAEILSGLEPASREYQVMRKDGGKFPILMHANAILEDGVPKGVRGIAVDITERKEAEEALRKSLERFQMANRATFDVIWDWNLQTDALRWNENIQTLFGYKAEEIEPGIESWTNRIHPEDLARVKTGIHAAIASGQEHWFDQYRFRRKDGMYAEVEDRGYIARDASGRPARMIGAMRDISERIQSEKTIKASEARYRVLVENASEAILVVQDGLLKFVNRTATQMIGYPEMERISRPFPEFIHPDDREMVVDNYRKRIAGETAQARYVFRLLTRDGGVRWVEIGAVLIDWEGRPASLNFLTDVTDRHNGEESIQASLREKEVMLREIHHRVKNNMQVISSLFNLQAGKTANEEYREILKEGQTRIRAMSLVHEKLYQSRDLSKIDLAVYIQSLADHLFNVYLTDSNRIRLETDLEEVPLDINSAVPCGLILNEVISNSLKHAFPEGRKGLIRIGLKRGPDDMIILRVSDDGIGFPKDIDFLQFESLGLQIAKLLVGQLEGTIDLDRTNGTTFTVTFRELKYAPRI